ncbi:flavodoxin-dependent (E)-4-hydroxy-3-methylbut-2-enyl-diphosphate synthase [Candidatus Gracilibacteria bacterium]|nr:flavodoxin-dependent (E)-4-hydroxy-3-methylbut-2-enyl-diphosphate synthase [Candidatus Gracilibacteria bacterium]
MLKKRRITHTVMVGNIPIGSEHPIVIQSMTNTPTRDIEATVAQIIELADAGSELVRITINDDAAALAVPEIVKILRSKGYMTPIVGDFHYNGHILLEKYPEMARSISKYRVNPGNVGKGNRHDENYKKFIECAIKYDLPVRIGVNGGSLDEELLDANMEANAKLEIPKSGQDVYIDTMVESGIISARKAVEWGLAPEKIIISVKMSDLQSMIAAYERISPQCMYPLHLGLTEAGAGTKGIVSSAAALSILLEQGIGDTIRVSLTPEPGAPRSLEVDICRDILQSMGFRAFEPVIVSCPGCGRTSSDKFQILAKYVKERIREKMPEWKMKYRGFESTHIAVMGCIVNGIGEAKHADIGIFIPGDAEAPQLQIYVKGEHYKSLEGRDILSVGREFLEVIEGYLEKEYKM